MANNCPSCGKALNAKDYCTSCKIDIHAYKQIKQASKLLYNVGLQKAKTRDLSGAIESLERSIKYDKTNIDARNLLGLVYFEIGEFVLALKNWVVSENLQPDNNAASRYLNKIKDNQINLDRLNTAIKKYNQALQYIEQGSIDLATIQLKKVVAMNPKFVKAYCLLALIYVKDQENDKALRELVKVLTIDKSNYIALKYYEDLGASSIEEAIEAPEKQVAKQKTRVKRQQFLNQSVQQFLGVVFGLAVGAALIYFLIMPSRIDEKDTIIDGHLTTIADRTKVIDELNVEMLTSTNEIKALELELKNATEENVQLSEKDNKVRLLMLCMTSYLEGDLVSSAGYLDDVDITDSMDGVLNGLYSQLKDIVYVELAQISYDEGKYYYDRYNYDEAIIRFTNGFDYLADDAEFADYYYYFYARSYQRSAREDRLEKALPLFEYLLEYYPDTNLKNDATGQLNLIKQTLEID